MKKAEIFFLTSAFVFLGLVISIHLLATYNYFIFIGHFNVNRLQTQFLFLALALLLASGLCFWMRTSKQHTKHRLVGKIIRYIFGVLGFAFIFICMSLDLFIFNPRSYKTLFDNGDYCIIKKWDLVDSSVSSITGYKNEKQFLKKKVYYKSFSNLKDVNLFDEYIVISYSTSYNGSSVEEIQYFSEWE